MRREGDWVMVRLGDGSEGRMRADRFESWLRAQSAPAVTREDVLEGLERTRRSLVWQLIGLAALLAFIGLAFLVLALLHG